MWEAYRNTVDDEGETLEDAISEANRTMSGVYGEVLTDCSFFVAQSGKLIGACVVTNFEGAPLLAFSMTHPDSCRRGIAESLIGMALDRLESEGHAEIFLYVTIANVPAVCMYEKLGFVREPDAVKC
jgi:ribosomal protein S18 acetylase RimI-like enzyme